MGMRVMIRCINIFVLTLLFLCLVFAPSSFALSNKEYRKMMKDSNFAEADNQLNKIWAELKENMPRKDFSLLEKDRDEWVLRGRDNTAQALMQKEKCSKIEAYTRATKMRSEYLKKIMQKYAVINLNTEEKAENFLCDELLKRGLMKDSHIVMSEETSETINDEECWIFRHAENGSDMIFTIDFYAVSTTGKIYVIDYAEDEYIPFNF